jgi:hypothetical protein
MDDLDSWMTPRRQGHPWRKGHPWARKRDVTMPSAVISQPIDQLFGSARTHFAGTFWRFLRTEGGVWLAEPITGVLARAAPLSFDDVVGELLEMKRNVDAESLRSLEIKD